MCACSQVRETVEHFLFRYSATRRESLSFYLGGKAPSDPKEWSPDMKAVRETIKYEMATGRLDVDDEQRQTQ